MRRGKLIVIEGLDGSGKATQTKRLVECLQDKGGIVRKVTFPDYTNKSSTLVRMYLSGQIGSVGEVNPYAATSFYAADRYISYQNDWKNDYLSGHTIVSDRYTTSNAAHQMCKLPQEEWNSYLRWLEDYEYVRLALPRPDVVVYLDMHPETSRMLIRKRSEENNMPMDIHEENYEYLLKCRKSALYAADRLHWQVVRCCDGKNPFSPDEVFRRVAETVRKQHICESREKP